MEVAAPDDDLKKDLEQEFMTFTVLGHHELALKLLDEHPDFDCDNSYCPLRLAIDNDDALLVSAISSRIKDINFLKYPLKVAVETLPANPLPYAIYCQKFKAAKALLDAGADPSLATGSGNALYYACKARSPLETYSLIEDMLQKGAKEHINVKVEELWGPSSCPLHHAANSPSGGQLTKLLIENGADVDAVTGYGFTSLYFALKNENIEVASALLEAGANPFGYVAPKGDTIISSYIYGPSNNEEIQLMLKVARANWIFKRYKHLFMLFKYETDDLQLQGIRDAFLNVVGPYLFHLCVDDMTENKKYSFLPCEFQ